MYSVIQQVLDNQNISKNHKKDKRRKIRECVQCGSLFILTNNLTKISISQIRDQNLFGHLVAHVK